MNISIFDVIGPVMIGPSSSHTAGAARLARVAGMIAKRFVTHVSFDLHGSFARTYKGHGTDKALVAGVLGMAEDDENIVNAFKLAELRGLTYEINTVVLENQHENSVRFAFTLDNGELFNVTGSSLGGGRILITQIGEFSVELSAQSPALLIQHRDRTGVVGEITNILAQNNINIATMKLSRRAKGDLAFSVIETDNPLGIGIENVISAISDVLYVKSVDTGAEV